MSYSDPSSFRMLRYDYYLRSFKVIQPSSYLNDPAIIKPKNSTFHHDFLRLNLNRMKHVFVAAVPYLSVMYSGGVLHIQSHAQSTETLFHFIQGVALLAVLSLPKRMKSKEKPAFNQRRKTVKQATVTTVKMTYFILCGEQMDSLHLAGCFHEHLTEPQEIIQLKQREGGRLDTVL